MSLCGLFASLLVPINFFNQFQTLFFLILHNHQTIDSYHCSSSWPPLSFLSPSRKIVPTRNQLKHRTLEITPHIFFTLVLPILHLSFPPKTPSLKQTGALDVISATTQLNSHQHPFPSHPLSIRHCWWSLPHRHCRRLSTRSRLPNLHHCLPASPKAHQLPILKPPHRR